MQFDCSQCSNSYTTRAIKKRRTCGHSNAAKTTCAAKHGAANTSPDRLQNCARRELLLAVGLLSSTRHALAKEKLETMEQLKGKDYGKERQRYTDYTKTDSGLQYQDIRVGTGEEPKEGSTVSIDWDGYTIGYYGRPFQARNKVVLSVQCRLQSLAAGLKARIQSQNRAYNLLLSAVAAHAAPYPTEKSSSWRLSLEDLMQAKGGSFGQGADRDLYSFRIGSQTVIPAIEEAVASMRQGGIRRIIVPVELGYPDNDFNKRGPKPSTFSGQRALDFVLKNRGLIDKTLLIDVELVKVS